MTAGLLLASGGLDSTTLAYWLRERGVEVRPVFFDYGQHCVEKEWSTVSRVLPAGMQAPERIDISQIFRGSKSRLILEADPWTETINDADLYLPYRTLLFFSMAASYAQTHGFNDVYSAFINSNHAKELDCSATFLNELDELAANVGAVRFHMPFRDWSKEQVTREALRLGISIGSTFSCQLLSDTPCGACPNCVERITAIQKVAAV